MPQSLITPKAFRFLRELAKNNDREWFAQNKQRYIDDVRDPLLLFVAAFAPKLAEISRHLVADARPVGGSLFRIYRDTRFSRDKSPYKTASAMGFHHAADDGPGFYLHIEPGRVFAGCGVWRPEPPSLQKIRERIANRPQEWKKVLATRGVALDDGYEDDRLKRPPQGFDPQHPYIEDLKRKRFTSSVTFTEAETCAPSFLARFTAACRQRAPLMSFLCRALGVPW